MGVFGPSLHGFQNRTTMLSFIDLSPVPRPVNKLPVAMYPSAMPVIIALMPDPLSNRRNPYSFRSVLPMWADCCFPCRWAIMAIISTILICSVYKCIYQKCGAEKYGGSFPWPVSPGPCWRRYQQGKAQYHGKRYEKNIFLFHFYLHFSFIILDVLFSKKFTMNWKFNWNDDYFPWK